MSDARSELPASDDPFFRVICVCQLAEKSGLMPFSACCFYSLQSSLEFCLDVFDTCSQCSPYFALYDAGCVSFCQL